MIKHAILDNFWRPFVNVSTISSIPGEQAIKLQKSDFFFLRDGENYYILFNQITHNRMKKKIFVCCGNE